MNDTEDDEMSKTDTASNLKVPRPSKKVVELEIGMIEVGPRMRLANDGHVADLGKDIADRGLMEPITVFLIKNDGQVSYRLSDGLHRLTACKNLGWVTISAFVREGDEIDRELWEIDETLFQLPLRKLQLGKYLERRKEIYEAKGGRNIGFAEDTEKKTGMPKSRVNEMVGLAAKIPDDVAKQIYDTPIADNIEELKALARVPANLQRAVVAEVKSGEFKSVREALGVNFHPDTKKQFKALDRAWRNADASVQERFLQSIGAKIDGKGPPAAAASTKVGVGATDEDPGEGAADEMPYPLDIPTHLDRRPAADEMPYPLDIPR